MTRRARCPCRAAPLPHRRSPLSTRTAPAMAERGRHRRARRGEIPGFEKHLRRAAEGKILAEQKGTHRGIAYGVPKDAVLRPEPAFDSETGWDPSTSVQRTCADTVRNTVAADILVCVSEPFQPIANTKYHSKSPTGVVRRGSPRALAATASTLRSSDDYEVAAEMELYRLRKSGVASPGSSGGLPTAANVAARVHVSPTALTSPTAAVVRKSPSSRVPTPGTKDRLAWFAQLRRETESRVASLEAAEKSPAASRQSGHSPLPAFTLSTTGTLRGDGAVAGATRALTSLGEAEGGDSAIRAPPGL